MKKYLILSLILVQILVGFRVNAAVEFISSTMYSDANKVAYWQLENVNDNGGTYNLTNVNTSTFTSGKYSNAVTLNGSSQYVYNSNIVFTDVDAMSVVGWFYCTDYSGTPSVVMSKLTSNAVGEVYNLRISNAGKPEFLTWASSGGFSTITSGSAISTNTWYHFAIVTVSTSDRRLFINGSKVGNSTNARTPNTSSKSGISIGSYDYGTGIANYFPGKIDDVVFFNDALSDTEVANLYNESAAATSAARAGVINFE